MSYPHKKVLFCVVSFLSSCVFFSTISYCPPPTPEQEDETVRQLLSRVSQEIIGDQTGEEAPQRAAVSKTDISERLEELTREYDEKTYRKIRSSTQRVLEELSLEYGKPEDAPQRSAKEMPKDVAAGLEEAKGPPKKRKRPEATSQSAPLPSKALEAQGGEEPQRGPAREAGESVLDYYCRVSGNPKRYATMLSLDGGGFRGLMQAYWLEHLESKDVTNRKIHQIFNMVAGTSIGGILAAGATVPGDDPGNPVLTPARMIELFTTRGHEIFPQRGRFYALRIYDWAREILHCRYDGEPLERLLQSYFRDKRLGSSLTNTIITAAIADSQEPFLFSSYEEDRSGYMAWEAARATSAAPTYFPSFPLILPGKDRVQYLLDGGLWVNNPSHIAYTEVLQWARKKDHIVLADNMIVLSFGTGKMPREHIQPVRGGWGNSAYPVIESMMNILSEGVHGSMGRTLPRGNYKRINPELEVAIELDKVSPDNILLLREAAETQKDAIERFVLDERLRLILEREEH